MSVDVHGGMPACKQTPSRWPTRGFMVILLIHTFDETEGVEFPEQ